MTLAQVVVAFDAKRTGSGWMAKCPAHEDHTPSLSIDVGKDGKILLKCFAGCSLPDILRSKNLVIKDLFGDFQQDNGTKPVPPPPDPVAFDWNACVEAIGEKALQALAKARGFTFEFAAELKLRKMIGLHHGHFCVPVYENGNVVGVQYRIKEDHSWRYYPEGIHTTPWVIGAIEATNPIEMFESNFDGFAYIFQSGNWDNIIITRGTSNARAAAALVPRGAVTRLWTQNDTPGEQWEADFCAACRCTVKRVKIPIVFKDLNQWLQDGEVTVNQLVEAIGQAETIHEPVPGKEPPPTEEEDAWTEKIVVGASVSTKDMEGLTLIPREPLLHQWFCEADLGLVFGPRGSAKTWFMLGIAQALTTGGQFGEWPAPKAVKVLYVDGEMPPDMMRSRCRGLQAMNENLLLLNHQILFDRYNKTLNITRPDIQNSLTEACLSLNIKVLILDNLSTLGVGMKENDSDSWEKVNYWLLTLRRKGIAVVIVHHAGRSGELRGTSRREDNVFWIIVLDESKKDIEAKRGVRFMSRFTKPSRNTQDEIPVYEWHMVTENEDLVTVSCKEGHSLQVFHAIIESGVTKPSEIARLMNVPDWQVSRLAKKAMDEGWLFKSSRGEYSLTKPKPRGRKTDEDDE